MVAISPLSAEHTAAMAKKHKISFPILRDDGNSLADAFGLRFELPDDLSAVYGQFGIVLPEVNDEPSNTLPMPARYVVGTDGIIRDAQVHPDYTRRPEPEETLAALRALADS